MRNTIKIQHLIKKGPNYKLRKMANYLSLGFLSQRHSGDEELGVGVLFGIKLQEAGEGLGGARKRGEANPMVHYQSHHYEQLGSIPPEFLRWVENVSQNGSPERRRRLSFIHPFLSPLAEVWPQRH